jgi:DNA-binding response OmpR family regulator
MERHYGQSPHLLTIDDDRKLCRLIRQYLELEGSILSVVHTGGDGTRDGIKGAYE